jgi:hypothetical protein
VSWLTKYILPWKKEKDCCTWWPDSVWQDCCCQHDYDYRYKPDDISKFQADKELRDCVVASGHRHIGNLMQMGVLVFGWGPWIKHRLFPKKRKEE